MLFRTIHNKPINPISYTTNILKQDPYVEIHIGTDSQRFADKITYVTVIAYRYPSRGVHYIYHKHQIEGQLDNWSRLWLETDYSLKIANKLSDNLPGVKFEIDMDYNNDDQYMSNKLVAATSGWARSYGYKVNIKPNKQIATRAADYHCK